MTDTDRSVWVRLVATVIFWCAVILAAINMSTEFLRDTVICIAIAVLAGLVWLGCLVRDDILRQRDILAAAPHPRIPVPLDDIEFDEELPWVTSADLRPHWDTDVMGAPE